MEVMEAMEDMAVMELGEMAVDGEVTEEVMVVTEEDMEDMTWDMVVTEEATVGMICMEVAMGQVELLHKIKVATALQTVAVVQKLTNGLYRFLS